MASVSSRKSCASRPYASVRRLPRNQSSPCVGSAQCTAGDAFQPGRCDHRRPSVPARCLRMHASTAPQHCSRLHVQFRTMLWSSACIHAEATSAAVWITAAAATSACVPCPNCCMHAATSRLAGCRPAQALPVLAPVSCASPAVATALVVLKPAGAGCSGSVASAGALTGSSASLCLSCLSTCDHCSHHWSVS